MNPPKVELCENKQTSNLQSGEAAAATCKFQDQYFEQTAWWSPKATTTGGRVEHDPTEQPATPEAIPGKSVTIPLTVGHEDRAYQFYWPKNHPLTDKLKVVYAADGLATAETDPSFHLGVQGGLFAEADADGFAVASLKPETKESFGLGLITMHFWNTHNSVLGFDPKKQDDALYAAAVQTDVSKHFNVEASHDKQFCDGFSNGGNLCREMDVKGVALISSTKLVHEQSTKPGTSALIVHGLDDQILPYFGGTYGPSSRVGFNIWWVQNNLANGKFNESLPVSLLPDYVETNNMTSAHFEDNQYFHKSSFASSDTSVQAIEYLMKPPYAGHNYSGGHAEPDSGNLWSANTNVIPRNIFDVNKVAACFFGLRKKDDCNQEGATD
ncbi:MAG TPA: hypothetical protein V6C97_08425 [Oculatellaceae cyanobacterium]